MLAIGEKSHEPLRRNFSKVKLYSSSSSDNALLRSAVEAINDTIQENGLVPSRLDIGVVPRFPIISTDLLNQKEGM